MKKIFRADNNDKKINMKSDTLYFKSYKKKALQRNKSKYSFINFFN